MNTPMNIRTNVRTLALPGAVSGATLPLAAVAAALLLGVALVALTGAPVGAALAAFIDGAAGSPYAVAASINRALALALIGTGFVLADRAKLTNVGGEGQIAIGGMAATAVSLYGGVQHLPFGLAFALPMLAAALAGACWGGIAGALKAKAGTNEVISTLMLSFIGIWLLYWSVQSVNLLRQPMSNSGTLPESAEIPLSTHLPWFFGDESMPLHLGLPLALLLGVLVAAVLARTLFGIHLRAVGLNPVAARRAGMPIARTIVLAMMLAGALGGLAGAVMLQGEQYVLKSGFSSGYGFDGLVVGLLARGSISGVFAGALLFGFLRSGGINMEMVASVPSALVLVVQGVIILTVAGAANLKRQGARA
jgi:simple sugar transport system permease protein